MSLIEIDKRGLLTAIGSTLIVLVVAYIDFFTTAYILAKIGLTIGGIGITLLWFSTTATIQRGEEEKRKEKKLAEQPIASPLTYKTMP